MKKRKSSKKIIKKQKHIIRKRRGGSMENQQANWGDSPEEQEAFNRPSNSEEIKRLKILPGDYQLSFIGNPFFYKRHWLDKQKRSVNCPGEGCPLCGSGTLPDGRYVANVYYGKEKAVYIYEFSRGIKNEIANTLRLWGNNIDAFDIVLTRVGLKKDDTKYSTVAVPRLEKLPKELKPYELSKIYKPTPIDAIIKILEGKVEEKKEAPKAQESTGTGAAPAESASPAVNTSAPVIPEKEKEGEVIIEDETADIDLDKLIESDNG